MKLANMWCNSLAIFSNDERKKYFLLSFLTVMRMYKNMIKSVFFIVLTSLIIIANIFSVFIDLDSLTTILMRSILISYCVVMARSSIKFKDSSYIKAMCTFEYLLIILISVFTYWSTMLTTYIFCFWFDSNKTMPSLIVTLARSLVFIVYQMPLLLISMGVWNIFWYIMNYSAYVFGNTWIAQVLYILALPIAVGWYVHMYIYFVYQSTSSYTQGI